MDNSGIKYSFVDIAKDENDIDSPAQITAKPEKPTTPPLSTTLNTADQVDKLRKQLQARLGDVPSAKFETETIGSGVDRQYKLVVTGLTDSQRKALQPISLSFKQNLKESEDLEMRQMLVRAGIIK